MTIKQILSDIWNKRYLNSKERYARREKIAEIACAVAAIGLVSVLFIMMIIEASNK